VFVVEGVGYEGSKGMAADIILCKLVEEKDKGRALDNVVDLGFTLKVEIERGIKQFCGFFIVDYTRIEGADRPSRPTICGFLSEYNAACRRTGMDRQFLYVNGWPCTSTRYEASPGLYFHMGLEDIQRSVSII